MKISRISMYECDLRLFVKAALCGLCLAAFASPTAALTVTTVAAGLHNPRGLNFSPDGALYVAEAAANGTPGAGCGLMGDGNIKCSSTTGSIARIDLSSGTIERVLTSIPSLIAPNGSGAGATGVHDISFQGLGNAYISIGLGGNPTLRNAYFGAAGDLYARLGRFNPSGRARLLEDLGGYEISANPDGGLIDSNPYGILALPGRVVYADAGGNSLNQVAANGSITTLAVFPNQLVTRPNGAMIPVQAVPTSVALGPDGYLYVGQLTGGPFTIGAANVFRVPADGGSPEVAASGFTNIIDIAFGADGSLYVLEIARNAIPNFGQGGRLVRIAPDGTRSDIISGPPLIAPGGIAVGKDGALYVTNQSTSPLTGEVLRIEL